MAFLTDAIEAGFTAEQAEFMNDFLAKIPHDHTIEQVIGLDEVLENLETEEGEMEEEEER